MTLVLPTALAAALLTVPASAQDAPADVGATSLLRADAEPPARPYPERPWFTRFRGVRVEPAAVQRLGSGLDVDLELFDGRRVRLAPGTVRPTGPAGFVTSGGLDGDPLGSFTLAKERGVVVAHVRTGDGGLFAVRQLTGSQHYLVEVDAARQPRCGLDQGPAAPALPLPPPIAGGTGDEPMLPESGGAFPFDVLVVYTTLAAEFHGSHLGLKAAVEVAIQEGNDAFANSAVDASLCLVGVMHVDYDETNDELIDGLGKLGNDSDGVMDEVHGWRDVCGADFYALIAEPPDEEEACGWAPVLPQPTPSNADVFAYSATAASCLDNFTFIHELGHNFGCHHDLDNSPGPPLSYGDAYGHRFTGDSGTEWRTIMAYAPGTRILNYSNPGVFHDGEATGKIWIPGQSTGAFNAAAITNNKVGMTHYRATEPKSAQVWVDLVKPNGLFENGTQLDPFNRLQEGLLRAAAGGTVHLSGSQPASSFVPVIVQDVRLDADAGSVQLGQ